MEGKDNKKPMNSKGSLHRKRLTSRSHYKASIILYELEKGIIPEWIDWEVKPQHIEILRMFVIDGLNFHEIARTGLLISKRGKPMSEDMIRLWVKRYLPFIQYDEKQDCSRRGRDKRDKNEFDRAKKLLPKEKCAICGSTKDLELDHILTYYAGGTSEIQNLQWLCHNCHKKKTKQEQREFNWR